MLFQDRKDAGARLAQALEIFSNQDVVVFALPRGGVVLGAEIAKKLDAPLDLVLTKKIGHPLNPEYAICAIAEEGEPICNQRELANVDPTWFLKEIERTRAELERRRVEYLGEAEPVDVEGKVAIIVDDGIATGFTMMAAIKELEKRGARQIVVAIPVTPADTAQRLISMGVELVSLKIDKNYLGAVGAYYGNFRQVTDAEVISLLKKSR
ncbi:MAG: phosphoribosyltransferase family protein [Anaerolineaceae bacterium]|jgi:predicted phosphoribosyltransferase|nr:phosphoribosyltransferase family protein [Anaerolineaceae bacterium]MDD4042874.1 phosphoribosyltransferase family protein [Anaerolineaceae bacterium]MDD4577134.1 phosphoribosyltransferase family protein [Anaerolineaceae bacterium]